MKLILSFIISSAFFVSNTIAQDSTKTFHNNSFRPPEYPGGNSAFAEYISKNLKYPEIAQLIGINGNIRLSFVLDKSGKVVEVTPINCIGAGCEAEAVKVLEMSPVWQPGIQKGKAVRVRYTIPISFSIPKGKVKMRDLSASKYGFVFNIKGKLYNLSEAQTILGNDFESSQIEISEPFYNIENDPKYIMPDKKEIYTITIKA